MVKTKSSKLVRDRSPAMKVSCPFCTVKTKFATLVWDRSTPMTCAASKISNMASDVFSCVRKGGSGSLTHPQLPGIKFHREINYKAFMSRKETPEYQAWIAEERRKLEA